MRRVGLARAAAAAAASSSYAATAAATALLLALCEPPKFELDLVGRHIAIERRAARNLCGGGAEDEVFVRDTRLQQPLHRAELLIVAVVLLFFLLFLLCAAAATAPRVLAR